MVTENRASKADGVAIGKIASLLDLPLETVYVKLRQLSDKGLIEGLDVGSSLEVIRFTERGREILGKMT